MADEINKLLATPEPVVIAGRTIPLTPAPFFKLQHVVVPMILNGLLVLGEQPEDYVVMGKDATALVSFLSGQPQAWVDALEDGEGDKLMEAVLRVNATFFTHHLPGALSRVLLRLLGGKSRDLPPTESGPTTAVEAGQPPSNG